MHPKAVGIAWCRPRGQDKVHNSSLLFNIRFSTYVKIFYPPAKDFPVGYGSAYMLGLMLPDLLLIPNVPLVLLEDDVIFVHDFNNRLQHALGEVEADMTKRESRRPFSFLLNLYHANATMSNLDNLLPHYHATIDKRKTKSVLVRGPPAYGFGNQGVYYSSAMRRDLTQFFFLALKNLIPYKHYFSDMYVNNYLWMASNCSRQERRCPCEAYQMRPSMLEHIGASSSWNSSRMHFAFDFPYKIEFPRKDEDGTWK